MAEKRDNLTSCLRNGHAEAQRAEQQLSAQRLAMAECFKAHLSELTQLLLTHFTTPGLGDTR
jgi:hypothetical protein